MEKKINIIELLRECPEGMELDCVLFDDVVFDEIDDDEYCGCPIVIKTKEGETWNLTSTGCWDDSPSAKCVIFPKGKTTWEGFVPPCQFKDGDVVAHQNHMGTWIGIYHKHDYLNETFSSYCCIGRDGKFWADFNNDHGYGKTRLATEEEKQKLFNAIKANGYKWNAESKTLEKLIEPQFKVGDRIRHKEKTKWTCVIRRIDDRYWVDEHPMCYTLPFGKQDEYELVPNKFDITTLKPFDKILVRDTDNDMWIAALFSHLRGTRFYTVSTWYSQCIPFEGNQHLLGTTNDCDEFYKTWE